MLAFVGGVYHFGVKGAEYTAFGWSQCLAVSFETSIADHSWDTVLLQFYSYYQQSQTVYVLQSVLHCLNMPCYTELKVIRNVSNRILLKLNIYSINCYIL